MMVKYSKDLIASAKSLFKQGISFPSIAKKLGIKRPMTVYDWSVKFGWNRDAISSKPSPKPDSQVSVQSLFVSNLDIAIKLGQDTISHLSTKLASDQITTGEAIKIMEKLPNFIRFLKTQAAQFEPKQEPVKQEITAIRPDVLQLLDSIADEQ